MGLSLADAAVRGNKSATDIDEQKQSLLSSGNIEGLIGLNRSIFGGATMMAKEDDADDDADDDDDDADDDDDDDDDSDDDDDEDDKEKGKKKPDPKDVRIQELSAEAKKKRLRIRKQAERVAELEAENARLKGKGKKKVKDDDEDDADEAEDSEEAKAALEENKTLKETLRKQTIRTEFTDILSQPKQKIKFKDPKVAFRLLDLEEVDVDEDGDVDGLEDAIKALAKKAPYLLVDDEKDEDDEDDEQPRRRKTGQRTGGGRGKGKPNETALRKKYNIQR